MKNVDTEQIKEKVRKLPKYGTHIRGFPPEVSKHIKGLLWKNLRSHFSPVECLEILVKTWLQSRKLVAGYPLAVKMLESYGPQARKEFPVFGGLFIVLSEKLGDGRKAYNEVIKPFMADLAEISMPALYEVDQLEKMDDPFEAFKEYNFGMLGNDPLYPIDEFVDNGDHFRFKIQKCIQNDISKAFEIDEMAEVGCDHDCFAYPLIEDRVHAVFRRPETLAKGGSCCDFNFYRKGTEPKGPYENK